MIDDQISPENEDNAGQDLEHHFFARTQIVQVIQDPRDEQKPHPRKKRPVRLQFRLEQQRPKRERHEHADPTDQRDLPVVMFASPRDIDQTDPFGGQAKSVDEVHRQSRSKRRQEN